jgi:hypothetical protein
MPRRTDLGQGDGLRRLDRRDLRASEQTTEQDRDHQWHDHFDRLLGDHDPEGGGEGDDPGHGSGGDRGRLGGSGFLQRCDRAGLQVEEELLDRTHQSGRTIVRKSLQVFGSSSTFQGNRK